MTAVMPGRAIDIVLAAVDALCQRVFEIRYRPAGRIDPHLCDDTAPEIAYALVAGVDAARASDAAEHPTPCCPGPAS